MANSSTGLDELLLSCYSEDTPSTPSVVPHCTSAPQHFTSPTTPGSCELCPLPTDQLHFLVDPSQLAQLHPTATEPIQPVVTTVGTSSISDQHIDPPGISNSMPESVPVMPAESTATS
ncbi:hypothetical protein L1987_03596 [Smallanthus sonchifolius]|uniref:Uncharacterized protein n=1 Tax=Smallanthus sonchifolius TaxID=185202 RepID=A0ACB9KAZ2_9ASTR|nr:hypothetical protein L1987_03596 [Smallanthus sonchifolius]